MLQITTLSELTIDGRLSLGPGASSKELFAFYGPELGRWFHAQRAACDAIMVGAGTVRADDPELTVRHVEGPNPLRVVPSTDGRLPPHATILNDGLPTLVAVSDRAADETVASLDARPGVEVVRCGAERVDLPRLAALLHARGVRTMIAEGGSHLLHALFAAGMVGRMVIKHVPVIAGRLDAPGFLPTDAPSLPLSRWRAVDWRLIGAVGVATYEPLPDERRTVRGEPSDDAATPRASPATSPRSR